MSALVLEWKSYEWQYVREYLGLTSSDVFDATGIDPYNVENRVRTDRIDKSRLANYYNRLLTAKHADFRMSVTPPERKPQGGKK